MGIITPTDGWDGWRKSKINEQQESTQKEIWEILSQKESDKCFNWNIHKLNISQVHLNSDNVDNCEEFTAEEKRNIETLEDILWNINPFGKEKAKNIKLNDEEINNLKIIIQKLWIDINIGYIEKVKDIGLNDEQIKNIKIIKDELWFNIWGTKEDIEKVKDIGLNDEQIKNIKIIKDELWFKIGIEDIEKVKDIRLNDEQIKNIKIIKDELWFQVKIEDIEEIKNIEQTNIEKINNLNIPKYEDDLYINNKELNDEEIRNIKILKNELRFVVNKRNMNIAKEIKLTQQEIRNIKILKNELRLNIGLEEINEIKNIELTSLQIKKIKFIKYELWYDVNKGNIKNLSKINYNKIEQIKELWININKYNLIKLSETDFNLDKLRKIKDLWININENNIIKLNETDFDFNKLWQIKEKIETFWIEINEHNIININNIKIENLQRMEEIFEQYWLIITIDRNDWKSLNLTEEEKSNLKNIRQIFIKDWIIISTTEELKIILDILSNTFENKKNYIEKKNEYLKMNQTLSNEKFNELFKTWDDKWKYWIQNIHQTDLWYCYAYSWFELLKKSNYFDVLIKTSMKETHYWREVKIPLWDLNWHIIKVNKEEIDKKYSFTDIDKKEERENININSNSSLWQKILEIAFIKEFLINLPEYLTKKPETQKDLLRFKNREKIIKKFKEKIESDYKKTWDIIITWELLNLLEWWYVNDFIERIMWNIINKYSTDNLESIKTIFDYINSWIIKIGLSYDTQELWPKKIEYKQKDWKKWKIESDHAYSIESTYTDNKTWEKYIVFVNPHDTRKKYSITLDECLKIFSNAEITTININKLFDNPLPQATD